MVWSHTCRCEPVADELREATVSSKKNLIFDTTLSNGQWTSDLIKNLQAKSYEVEVRAIVSPKLESELGVDGRFTREIDKKGTGRYVPEGAREAIYDKLPNSLNTVHAQSDVPIRIFNREGTELYDSRTDPRPPGQALEEARSSRRKDPTITQGLREGWRIRRNGIAICLSMCATFPTWVRTRKLGCLNSIRS